MGLGRVGFVLRGKDKSNGRLSQYDEQMLSSSKVMIVYCIFFSIEARQEYK